MFKLTKKKVAAAAAAAGLVAMTGVGYAYWTTSGSGTGTSSTTTGISDTLSFTTSTINAMYPGDSAQPFTVTVKNTDANESGYVASVKAYVTTDAAGCTGADFLLNGSAAPSLEADAVALTWTARDIAAGSQYATDGTDTIQFNNTTSDQDACKDAEVTLHYVAS